MDELTGQFEPDEEPDAEDVNDLENEFESEALLEPGQLAADAKNKLAPKLIEMPDLDTPAFWQWVEAPVDNRPAEPEALGWAIHEFARQDRMDKAERVFTSLYLIFEKRALTIARKNGYIKGAYSDAQADDVVSLAWQEIYKQLIRKDKPVTVYNFAGYFGTIVNSKARDLARKDKIIPRENTSRKAGGKGENEATRSSNAANKPAGAPKSLDATMSNEENFGEGNNLQAFLADPTAGVAFDMVEFIENYDDFLNRLTSEEKQILLLIVEEEMSVSTIADYLGRDWQTIDRRLNSIRETAALFDEGYRLRKTNQKKANRRKGNNPPADRG